MSKIRLHGSSSGYTEIAPVAASGNNTLTLPNDGTIISQDAAGAVGVTSVHTTNITATGIATITTAKIGAGVTISESGIEASGIGITCASINGTQIGGRRNLIINGAMNVAQRGTSSTTSGYYSVDRFASTYSGTDEATTQEQADVASGTTPYTLGFRKSFKITNGNQTSGAGAADMLRTRYVVEAQDVATSGWNYTDSNSFITLQFWIKSSVAQNFYGQIRAADGTSQSFSFETGSLTADTWTKVIKSIPGNSNLTFNNDSGAGIYIYFFPYSGTDYTDAGVSLNTWSAYASGTRTPVNTTTWYTTNDATIEFTGYQLEVGSQATAFEHRNFGDELALCQRYCYEHLFTGANQYASIMLGTYYMSSRIYGSFRFPVTMRTAPTMVCTDSADAFNCYRDGGVDFVNEFHIDSSNNVGPNGAEILNDTDASGTAGQSTFIRRGSNSTTTFRFEAEL